MTSAEQIVRHKWIPRSGEARSSESVSDSGSSEVEGRLCFGVLVGYVCSKKDIFEDVGDELKSTEDMSETISDCLLLVKLHVHLIHNPMWHSG
jgi:hypothetical protein